MEQIKKYVLFRIESFHSTLERDQLCSLFLSIDISDI